MKSLLLIFLCVAYVSAARLPYAGVRHGFTTLEKLSSRIIEGEPAKDGQFPWQAYLFSMADANQQIGYVCGGSVITEKTVVTAAHCVYQLFYYRIEVGSLRRWYGAQMFQFAGNATIHAGYDESTLNNDIAILTLPGTQKFTFNNYVQPIAIASVTYGSLENQLATVSGWGKDADNGTVTEYLNFVKLRVIPNAQCAAYYVAGLVIDSNLCAVSNNPSSIRPGTCNGDSGGPLISDSTGVPTLVGIVSFVSSRGCETEGPNGFTRVSSFNSWIQSNKV